MEQSEASASRSPWSWPVSQISRHLLYQPEGLRFIPWERELQIILSSGHGPNPCRSLPASERQIRSIYRAGEFFFQGEFSTWVSFSDTFRRSLRFWSFNTLPSHPTFTHIYVNIEIHIRMYLLFESPGVMVHESSAPLPRPSGAGTLGLKAVGKIPINQVFLPICINWAPCLPNPQAEYCFGRREDAFIKGKEKLVLFH